LGAFADERGENKYTGHWQNTAQRVKDFLVSEGLAVEKIDTSAYGKEKQLDKATVMDLQARNPNQTPEERIHTSAATWLAYNRRGGHCFATHECGICPLLPPTGSRFRNSLAEAEA